MYKVITHAIREEHFDHPMMAEMAINRGNIAPRTNGLSSAISQYDSHLAQMYRNQARTEFEAYLIYVRDYVVSVFNGGEDTAAIEQRIAQQAKSIAGLLQPYYGDEVAAVAEARLLDYTKHVLAVLQAIKTGSDKDAAKLKLKQTIETVAGTFSSVNPRWPLSAVAEYLTKFADAVIEQGMARKSKNWAADLDALTEARVGLLNGNYNIMPVYHSFAEVFSKGVISAFPERFTDYRIVY